MTREDIIRYAYNKNNLSLAEMGIFVSEYCIERGKPTDKTAEFVAALISRYPFISKECFKYALEWYRVKYNICYLCKPLSIIESMLSNPTIVLIY